MDMVDKCDIIASAWDVLAEDELWSPLFEYADLGVPFALGISNGHILDMSPEGEDLIQEAWEMLCYMMGLSSEEEWEDLEEMLIAAGMLQEA